MKIKCWAPLLLYRLKMTVSGFKKYSLALNANLISVTCMTFYRENEILMPFSGIRYYFSIIRLSI